MTKLLDKVKIRAAKYLCFEIKIFNSASKNIRNRTSLILYKYHNGLTQDYITDACIVHHPIYWLLDCVVSEYHCVGKQVILFILHASRGLLLVHCRQSISRIICLYNQGRVPASTPCLSKQLTLQGESPPKQVKHPLRQV